MKLTSIYTYKNFLAYVLLFSFINIINYIPDYAFQEDSTVLHSVIISDNEPAEETIPTSIVEVVLEDFFQFPESRFTYEELKDFSTNPNRYAKIAKSIQSPPFIELPRFATNVLSYKSENVFNAISTSYSQFINTLLHSAYISFVHLLYPF